MAITSIGVGSGLPLQDLLADLRASESQALTVIKNRQTSEQNRMSAYGRIKSAVEALQGATAALAKPEAFTTLKTSVSGGDGLSATASADAIAGSYKVKVETLATTQSLVTQGVASRTDALGDGGVITLTYGDGSTKTLDLTGKDTSIDGLIAAINGDDTLGLQATVLNDGSGTPHRLLITSTTTGTDAALSSISVAGNTNGGGGEPLADLLNFGDVGSTVSEQAASNAKIDINGITITSQTNTVEDAIEGVTLTLKAEDAAKTLNLTVSRDDEAATKAITNFVNAYNSLQGTIRSLTSFNTETQTANVLTGDSMARRVQDQVRGILTVSSSSGDIRSFADMGIEFNYQNGELKLDTAKLAKAMRDSQGDIAGFLQGPLGITERMSQITDNLLGSNGPITSATKGVDQTIKTLKEQYDTASARIDSRMAIYQKQFSALDKMLAEMNSVSSYLTTQLSALENLTNQTKK